MEPITTLIEVEGNLEDILTEVFRKRVCPMLDCCPADPIRLLVATDPQRVRDGAVGENFFTPGGQGRPPEFLWQARGALQEVVQHFRFDFLGQFGPYSLQCYVLFALYQESGATAAEPRASDQTQPSPESFRLPSHSLIPSPPAPAEDEAAEPPLPQVVAQGGTERLTLPLVDRPIPEYVAEVIDAAASRLPLARDRFAPPPREEAAEVPEEIYQPLPSARVEVCPTAMAPPAPIANQAVPGASDEALPSPAAAEPPPAAPLEPEIPDTPETPDAPEATQVEPAGDQSDAPAVPDEAPPSPAPQAPTPGARRTPVYDPFTLVAAPRVGDSLYRNFFGFEAMPFRNTPDARFYFPAHAHQEALARLQDAIAERQGFALLTGEIGCGKTILCRELLGRLPAGAQTATITQTDLNPTQILRAIAEALGLQAGACGRYEILKLLSQYLNERSLAGAPVCVILDEAQNLDAEALESIRMINNLETAREKLLQIILLGQSELRQKIDDPQLRPLRQRIAVRVHLAPFGLAETAGYILHRLKVAAPRRPPVFGRGALLEAHRFSGGVPRLVNDLCDHALRQAFTRGKRVIRPRLIREAARELRLEPHYGRLARLIKRG